MKFLISFMLLLSSFSAFAASVSVPPTQPIRLERGFWRNKFFLGEKPATLNEIDAAMSANSEAAATYKKSKDFATASLTFMLAGSCAIILAALLPVILLEGLIVGLLFLVASIIFGFSSRSLLDKAIGIFNK